MQVLNCIKGADSNPTLNNDPVHTVPPRSSLQPESDTFAPKLPTTRLLSSVSPSASVSASPAPSASPPASASASASASPPASATCQPPARPDTDPQCASCRKLSGLLSEAIAHCRREENLNNHFIASQDRLSKRLAALEATNAVLRKKSRAAEDSAKTDTTVSQVVLGSACCTKISPADPNKVAETSQLPAAAVAAPVYAAAMASPSDALISTKSPNSTTPIKLTTPSETTKTTKPAKPIIHTKTNASTTAAISITKANNRPGRPRGRPRRPNPDHPLLHVLSTPTTSTTLTMHTMSIARSVSNTPKPSKPPKPPTTTTEARGRKIRVATGDFSISKMSFKDLMTKISVSTDDIYTDLILSVRQLAHSTVCDEFTESYFEEGLREPKARRLHDWTGRFEKVDQNIPDSVPIGNPPLRVGSNMETYGVPMCPLQLSKTRQFYTPRFRFPDYSIEIAFENVIATNASMKRFCHSEARTKALDAVRTDAITRSLFAKAMTTRQGNHKRTVRNRYFTLLNYTTFCPTSVESKDNFSREREKQMIYKTLVRGVTSALEAEQVEQIDCTWWRKAQWSDVQNPDRVSVAQPSTKLTDDSVVDALFANDAAREAFLALLGRQPSESESLLSLARADAWFTTASLLILLPEGSRGARNQVFSKTFAKLLPRCVEGIMRDFRTVVARHAAHELMKKDMRMFVSLDPATRLRKMLRLGDRKVTDVVYLPSQQRHYVYVSRSAFKALICDWIVFSDAYVGRAALPDSEFHPVIRPTTPDDTAGDGCATRQESCDEEDQAGGQRDDDVPFVRQRGGGGVQPKRLKAEDVEVEVAHMPHTRKRFREEADVHSLSAAEDDDMI